VAFHVLQGREGLFHRFGTAANSEGQAALVDAVGGANKNLDVEAAFDFFEVSVVLAEEEDRLFLVGESETPSHHGRPP
jgi:hypothetical protein